MASKKQIETPDTEKVWTEEEAWEPVTVRLPIIPGKEKQEAQFVAVNGRELRRHGHGVGHQCPSSMGSHLEHVSSMPTAGRSPHASQGPMAQTMTS